MNKLSKLYLLSLLTFLLIFSTCPCSHSTGNAQTNTIPGFACYRNLNTIYQTLTRLKTSYPEWVSLMDIGNSWEKDHLGQGHDLFALTIDNKARNEAKPSFFIVSGLKANAFAPVEVNLRFAEYLLKNYRNDDEIAYLLDSFSIHFIFVANPDGRTRAEAQADGFGEPEAITWTKNTNHSGCSNGNGGVSLENNFAYQWQEYPKDPCRADYPGASAQSEPETQAIATFIQSKVSDNPHPALLIHMESSQDRLITPYLYSKTHQVAHYDEYQILANKISFGTEAIPLPGDSELFNEQSGTLVDFAEAELGAIALYYSIGNPIVGGDVTNCAYFEETLLDTTLQSLLRAFKTLPNPLEYAAGPEIRDLKVVPDPKTRLVLFSGELDALSYYRYTNRRSYINAAYVSQNLPPWHPDATPLPITHLNTDPTHPGLAYFEFSLAMRELPPEGMNLFIHGTAIDPERNDAEDAGFVYRIVFDALDSKLLNYFPMIVTSP